MIEAVQLDSQPVKRGRSTKFTPKICNLVERGKSRDEIAEIIGVTTGTLQVTCSKLGISLRRPRIDNGMWKLTPRCESASLIHQPSDHSVRVPLQPTEQQSQASSGSEPRGAALIAKPQQQRMNTPEARPANVAIRFRYKGMEQITDLPLTLDMIGQLALEAELRETRIGDLIAELIMAMVSRDFFPQVDQHIDPATDQMGAEEIRRIG